MVAIKVLDSIKIVVGGTADGNDFIHVHSGSNQPMVFNLMATDRSKELRRFSKYVRELLSQKINIGICDFLAPPSCLGDFPAAFRSCNPTLFLAAEESDMPAGWTIHI